MALLLRNRGITRVRPLAGGLDAWVERGYPVEPVRPLTQVSSARSASSAVI